MLCLHLRGAITSVLHWTVLKWHLTQIAYFSVAIPSDYDLLIILLYVMAWLPLCTKLLAEVMPSKSMDLLPDT